MAGQGANLGRHGEHPVSQLVMGDAREKRRVDSPRERDSNASQVTQVVAQLRVLLVKLVPACHALLHSSAVALTLARTRPATHGAQVVYNSANVRPLREVPSLEVGT